MDIIKRNVLENSKPTDAVNEILEIDYFKHYLALKNPKQIQEFAQHMKRYLYMYMPNAGYEVADTKRYSERKLEACLIATKNWHVGDEIKLLTGVIATLDPKDDAELKKGNRDFSVMWSSRKKCTCLFLGPARFANHDCNSNCRFIAHGLNSIIFKVVKEIKCGDEITVFYGQHYFGENNCECKCVTCEKRSTGYYTISSTLPSITATKEPTLKTNTRPTRKRKPPASHEDYIQTTHKNRRLKCSAPPMSDEEEVEGRAKKKLKVMSIDFICNENNKKESERRKSDSALLGLPQDTIVNSNQLQKEITVVVQPDLYQSQGSPSDSTNADSAISLSPEADNKEGGILDDEDMDVLDQFLDDLSDLSSVSSSVSLFDEPVLKKQKNHNCTKPKKEKDLTCIACLRPLQNIPEQVGPDANLTHELATWTWSPSAVFTDWRPKRCPRCERHFTIFGQEWPTRREKKMVKKGRKSKNKKSVPMKIVATETVVTEVVATDVTATNTAATNTAATNTAATNTAATNTAVTNTAVTNTAVTNAVTDAVTNAVMNTTTDLLPNNQLNDAPSELVTSSLLSEDIKL
ncbi:hypothetical protein G6F57_011239 [Rhizopus arrhizus]|nr:hypothetical protein G6F21_011071 [Rhizopus arrhizus]KAG1410348.1 hypothetical protein G6F58_009194 [Rhizopus delemar]KAG0789929.1 hypothetical protein G6F22_006562 [Rhizopus arrhizus]KAG0806267.1 hypothetical protein G6F20_011259 [Rhizopus arrhizus]KAG0826532.1 hypothetical protein G6F19_009247 [Rhizopus arrhizus]